MLIARVIANPDPEHSFGVVVESDVDHVATVPLPDEVAALALVERLNSGPLLGLVRLTLADVEAIDDAEISDLTDRARSQLRDVRIALAARVSRRAALVATLTDEELAHVVSRRRAAGVATLTVPDYGAPIRVKTIVP